MALDQEDQSVGRQDVVNSSAPPAKKKMPLLLGCVFAFIIFVLGTQVITSVIGLVTGNLYTFGRGSGSGPIHGTWARIIGGVEIIIYVLIAIAVLRAKKKARDRNPFYDP